MFVEMQLVARKFLNTPAVLGIMRSRLTAALKPSVYGRDTFVLDHADLLEPTLQKGASGPQLKVPVAVFVTTFDAVVEAGGAGVTKFLPSGGPIILHALFDLDMTLASGVPTIRVTLADLSADKGSLGPLAGAELDRLLADALTSLRSSDITIPLKTLTTGPLAQLTQGFPMRAAGLAATFGDNSRLALRLELVDTGATPKDTTASWAAFRAGSLDVIAPAAEWGLLLDADLMQAAYARQVRAVLKASPSRTAWVTRDGKGNPVARVTVWVTLTKTYTVELTLSTDVAVPATNVLDLTSRVAVSCKVFGIDVLPVVRAGIPALDDLLNKLEAGRVDRQAVSIMDPCELVLEAAAGHERGLVISGTVVARPAVVARIDPQSLGWSEYYTDCGTGVRVVNAVMYVAGGAVITRVDLVENPGGAYGVAPDVVNGEIAVTFDEAKVGSLSPAPCRLIIQSTAGARCVDLGLPPAHPTPEHEKELREMAGQLCQETDPTVPYDEWIFWIRGVLTKELVDSLRPGPIPLLGPVGSPTPVDTTVKRPSVNTGGGVRRRWAVIGASAAISALAAVIGRAVAIAVRQGG